MFRRLSFIKSSNGRDIHDVCISYCFAHGTFLIVCSGKWFNNLHLHTTKITSTYKHLPSNILGIFRLRFSDIAWTLIRDSTFVGDIRIHFVCTRFDGSSVTWVSSACVIHDIGFDNNRKIFSFVQGHSSSKNGDQTAATLSSTFALLILIRSFAPGITLAFYVFFTLVAFSLLPGNIVMYFNIGKLARLHSRPTRLSTSPVCRESRPEVVYVFQNENKRQLRRQGKTKVSKKCWDSDGRKIARCTKYNVDLTAGLRTTIIESNILSSEGITSDLQRNITKQQLSDQEKCKNTKICPSTTDKQTENQTGNDLHF